MAEINYEVQSAPVEIKIVEDAGTVNKKKEEYWESIKGNIELAGFRKGHVDRKTYENKVGYFNAYRPVIDDIVFSTLEKIKDIQIVYVLEKRVTQFFDNLPLVVKVLADVKPKVEITGDYKNIEVGNSKIIVADEEVDKQLKSFVYSKAPAKPVTDRPAQKGDNVKVDCRIFVEEDQTWKLLPDNDFKNVNILLGNGKFNILPGIEDAIIGMSIGETKSIEEVVQEKKAKAEIKLREVSVREVPEINDELAKSFKYESLAEWKSKMRDNIAQFREAQKEMEKQGKLIDELIKRCEFSPIPKSLVKMQISSFLQSDCKKFGMDEKKFFESFKSSRAAYEEDRYEEALRFVKARLAFEKLAETEKIDYTKEEFTEEVSKESKRYKTNPEEYIERLGEKEIGDDLRISKAMLYLKNIVKYKEV